MKDGELWLLIDHDDPTNDVAWALEEDEILPIMKACEKYLKDKNVN